MPLDGIGPVANASHIENSLLSGEELQDDGKPIIIGNKSLGDSPEISFEVDNGTTNEPQIGDDELNDPNYWKKWVVAQSSQVGPDQQTITFNASFAATNGLDTGHAFSSSEMLVDAGTSNTYDSGYAEHSGNVFEQTADQSMEWEYDGSPVQTTVSPREIAVQAYHTNSSSLDDPSTLTRKEIQFYDQPYSDQGNIGFSGQVMDYEQPPVQSTQWGSNTPSADQIMADTVPSDDDLFADVDFTGGVASDADLNQPAAQPTGWESDDMSGIQTSVQSAPSVNQAFSGISNPAVFSDIRDLDQSMAQSTDSAPTIQTPVQTAPSSDQVSGGISNISISGNTFAIAPNVPSTQSTIKSPNATPATQKKAAVRDPGAGYKRPGFRGATKKNVSEQSQSTSLGGTSVATNNIVSGNVGATIEPAISEPDAWALAYNGLDKPQGYDARAHSPTFETSSASAAIEPPASTTQEWNVRDKMAAQAEVYRNLRHDDDDTDLNSEQDDDEQDDLEADLLAALESSDEDSADEIEDSADEIEDSADESEYFSQRRIAIPRSMRKNKEAATPVQQGVLSPLSLPSLNNSTVGPNPTLTPQNGTHQSSSSFGSSTMYGRTPSIPPQIGMSQVSPSPFLPTFVRSSTGNGQTPAAAPQVGSRNVGAAVEPAEQASEEDTAWADLDSVVKSAAATHSATKEPSPPVIGESDAWNAEKALEAMPDDDPDLDEPGSSTGNVQTMSQPAYQPATQPMSQPAFASSSGNPLYEPFFSAHPDQIVPEILQWHNEAMQLQNHLVNGPVQFSLRKMCDDPSLDLKQVMDRVEWIAELVQHGHAGWSRTELLHNNVRNLLGPLRSAYQILGIMKDGSDFLKPLDGNLERAIGQLKALKKQRG
jgi:hypothetical protein